MKKYFRFVPLLLVIFIVVLSLWYTRPMTITELCPAIDFEQCSRVHGYYYEYDGSNGAGDDVRFELTRDDAELAELLAAVEDREFRRSLNSLLPQGTKSHHLEEGDYKWDFIFTFDTLPFPDGTTGRGDILHISNFFGKLTLFYDGKSWQCSTSEQAAWIESIMEHIQAKEA